MRSIGKFFLIATALGLATDPALADDNLDRDRVGRFAQLALTCATQEYPNLIHHTMAGDDDLGPPRKLTPSFYGCYDWHSAVHGHWLLARAARLHPEAEFAAAAKATLAQNLTRENLLAEATYVARPARKGFERPYGLAWLLQLVAELDQWQDDDAQAWRASLQPLESIAVERLSDWIPKLHYPIRIGEHSQTAFAFGLVWDYAMQVENADLQMILRDAAARFYADDRHCPLAYEPSGHDFLSPCLAEADFMRRVMPASEFAAWLTGFLPQLTQADALAVGIVTDRKDGKLAHIDGLNISRAWMLEGIASGLPSADPRLGAVQTLAQTHADAGLAGVSDEHYAGGHWLGSFALYLISQRGLGDRH